MCAASLAMLSFSGCSDDINYDLATEGEGKVLLRPVLNCDVTVESRAIQTDDELAENALIWISNSKGAVRKYTGVDNVPAGGISLVSDSYIAEVWAGDSVPASFDHRYYKGAERFQITTGSTVQVNVECKIANSVVTVEYDDAVDEVLTGYSMTVGHKTGELVYEGRMDEGKPGYFMMPSIDRNLTCTLKGVLADGSEYTFTKVIEDAQPSTNYRVKVKHGGATEEDFGGGIIKIEVDETEIEVKDEITLDAAPTIEGTNFDMTKAVMGQEGQLTEKKMWIRSTNGFKEITVSCPSFGGMLGIDGDDFEVLGMKDNIREILSSKGFSYQRFTHENEAGMEGFEEVKLIFSDEFMNLFTNGEHNVTVTVTDNKGRMSTGVMQVVLSDAKTRTEAVADYDAWATKATLRGTVMKPEQTGIMFQYRERGKQQWETIAAAEDGCAEGTPVSVEVNGLTPGTTYEYQLVCDGFDTSDVMTFTTEEASQLPNAGMETWCTGSDGSALPAVSDKEGDLFWDCGNHGSQTLGKNVTVSSDEVKHSGNYSAKLMSQFVGVGILGKFAAGNLFVGKYLKTDGTDGVLGFGRGFTSRPRAMKVWVQYTPATVTENLKDRGPLAKGEMDQGMIYVALLDGSLEKDDKAGASGEYPVIIRTSTKYLKLFNSEAQNIVGYGEKVFTEATGGMIEVEIPIDYRTENVKVANIAVTCSASRYGDYFNGGPSVMYVDDFELVY